MALVQLAVRLGQSVLITSHTHSAVDNVLLRLRDKVDMLRLGAAHKLHPQLAAYADTAHDCTSPEEIHAFYSSKVGKRYAHRIDHSLPRQNGTYGKIL